MALMGLNSLPNNTWISLEAYPGGLMSCVVSVITKSDNVFNNNNLTL